MTLSVPGAFSHRSHNWQREPPNDPAFERIAVTLQGWRRILPMVLLLLATAGLSDLRSAIIVFDSYTPPASNSGFSSANGGHASQISVAQTIVITNISIYNQMLSAGDVKVLIIGAPSNSILYESSPLHFSAESTFSWKTTPSMSFTLEAGEQYWIGYVRNVGVNDLGDTIRESQNGITSGGDTAIISGYANPAYDRVFITGVDSPFRLWVVPEPSTMVLTAAAVLSLLRNRRR
jgi:hypothetical protein